MKNNITFLKVIYLIGIVIDGIWVIILAFPKLYKVITNNPEFLLDKDIRVIFIIAASLMLGWTILLYLGYKKPIERRFILLITAFPVVFGIFLGTLYSFFNGSSIAILFSIKTFLIMILYVYSFSKAEKISRSMQ